MIGGNLWNKKYVSKATGKDIDNIVNDAKFHLLDATLTGTGVNAVDPSEVFDISINFLILTKLETTAEWEVFIKQTLDEGYGVYHSTPESQLLNSSGVFTNILAPLNLMLAIAPIEGDNYLMIGIDSTGNVMSVVISTLSYTINDRGTL